MCAIGSCLLILFLSVGCSRAPDPSPSSDVDRTRESEVLESREGLASFVASALHGKETASGAAFDMNALVAAHPSYSFGTLVRVTNLENGKAVDVRIVDRGPASESRAEGVIIDLSRAAAEALGFIKNGRSKVRVDVLRWGQ
jgi:rare lipoprotein A